MNSNWKFSKSHCNGKKCIMLEDIKVNEKFNNCHKKFNYIISDIEKFALKQNINLIGLDDNAFMQFPDKYYSSINS